MTGLSTEEKTDLLCDSICKSDWDEIRNLVDNGDQSSMKKILKVVESTKNYCNISTIPAKHFMLHVISYIWCYLEREKEDEDIWDEEFNPDDIIPPYRAQILPLINEAVLQNLPKKDIQKIVDDFRKKIDLTEGSMELDELHYSEGIVKLIGFLRRNKI